MFIEHTFTRKVFIDQVATLGKEAVYSPVTELDNVMQIDGRLSGPSFFFVDTRVP